MPQVSEYVRRAVRRGAGVVLAVVICALAGSAGSEEYGGTSLQGWTFVVYRVDSSLYPFVAVYVRTFDENKRPLVNINSANVGLMVKGRSYDPTKRQYMVQTVKQRGGASRTVIVIDASQSMAGEPFNAALRAAARFFDSKRPQDEVAILAVRDTKEGYDIVSNFERDTGTLGRRLGDIRADGQKTRLYDTIGAAMQMATMASQVGEGEQAAPVVSSSIVVLSDGKDEGSALSRLELNARITSLPIPIPIFSFAYSRLSDAHFRNLESLSKNSFGVYYPIGEALDRMQRSIEEVHDIVQNDYVVTFRSYVPVDGEEHAFKIGVEYPSGSRRFNWQNAHFEAIESPPLPELEERSRQLARAIPARPDRNPHFERPAVSAGPQP